MYDINCTEMGAQPTRSLICRIPRFLLLLENLPQALAALYYLRREGGSTVVAVLNLAIPTVQAGRVRSRNGSLVNLAAACKTLNDQPRLFKLTSSRSSHPPIAPSIRA